VDGGWGRGGGVECWLVVVVERLLGGGRGAGFGRFVGDGNVMQRNGSGRGRGRERKRII